MAKYAMCTVCGYTIAIPNDAVASDYLCPIDKIPLVATTVGGYVKDYRDAIAEGKLTGYKRFTKFAFNTVIKSGALKILSSNLDIIHPDGKQLSIVSTSAQDGVGGTGIRKVYLEYWDSNWVFRSEVIDMNGLAEVNTAATDIYRIEALYAILTGTAGTAVGAITMSDVPAGANVYAQISI